MRQGTSNKRLRSRSRKSVSPLARVYDSNGPDVKVRGSAQQVADKYVQLSRDAQSSGDRVMAENYLQHAEHYYRILAAAQAGTPGREERDDIVRDDREDGWSAEDQPREVRDETGHDRSGPDVRNGAGHSREGERANGHDGAEAGHLNGANGHHHVAAHHNGAAEDDGAADEQPFAEGESYGLEGGEKDAGTGGASRSRSRSGTGRSRTTRSSRSSRSRRQGDGDLPKTDA